MSVEERKQYKMVQEDSTNSALQLQREAMPRKLAAAAAALLQATLLEAAAAAAAGRAGGCRESTWRRLELQRLSCTFF
jgi:hypothetical protein